jgi:hypothetical protein
MRKKSDDAFKGPRLSEANIEAAFREAGYADVAVRLKNSGRDAGTKVIFTLHPDSRPIVSMFRVFGDRLPESLHERTGLIRGMVRRAFANPANRIA